MSEIVAEKERQKHIEKRRETGRKREGAERKGERDSVSEIVAGKERQKHIEKGRKREKGRKGEREKGRKGEG